MRNENQTIDYAVAGMKQSKLKKEISKRFFLRRPYWGTSAETKDMTQTKLHELDYLK